MGKLLNRIGGAINWMAYIWLVTTEALEEISYIIVGDSIRGIISAAESRRYALKIERRATPRQNNAAEVADTP
jgi:hypothetical protein